MEAVDRALTYFRERPVRALLLLLITAAGFVIAGSLGFFGQALAEKMLENWDVIWRWLSPCDPLEELVGPC